MTKYKSGAADPSYDLNAYLLKDINGDGIKELIIQHSAGVRTRVIIFTYYKSKVKKVLDKYGVTGLNYNKKTQRIRLQSSSGAAYTYLDIYKLTSGKLKRTLAYSSGLANYDYTKPVFYRNKKKISQNTFIKAINKYAKWTNISPLSIGTSYH